MRRAEIRRRGLRADHRAVLAIAGLLLAAIAAQAVVVYAFVAVEALEEADRWMAYALVARAGRAADEPTSESVWGALQSAVDRPFSMRILDGRGSIVAEDGAWAQPEHLIPAQAGDVRGFRHFPSLQPNNYLTGGLPLVDGGRVELALPLAPFSDEVREVGLALALLAGASGLAALLVSALAISRAFSPLRRATQLVEGIDAHKLGQRLPTSGTGDPVDRHAEALNRVLADSDAAFDRLRAFSADVAHELRTPVNRLQTVAEVALLDGDESELKPALERVHAASQELSRTIQSLLLLAELDDRRVEPSRVATDLDAWLAHMVDIYAPIFEERGASLELRGSVGTLAVNRGLLDRVLSNLLDNALVYGGRGGRVEIRARRDESGARLAVDDAGPGIPLDVREHVFDRFTRLDRARSGPGTGLGLAVARACARRGGGDLRVGDSQLGGTCFVWELVPPGKESAAG